MRTRVLAVLGSLCATLPAPAATIHVCPDGTGAYPTIQAAVDAATSGDTIELCDGTFGGPGNFDLDFGTKSLNLRSLHGSDVTVIETAFYPDGGGESEPHFGIDLGPGSTTVIEGITIQHARRWNGAWGDGGAIHCDGGTLLLDRVVIDGWIDGEANRGGGVFISSGSLAATDCRFRTNRAYQRGGAIFAESSPVELERCVFEGSGSCGGGAVDLEEGSIVDCTFSHLGGPHCGDDPAGLGIQVMDPGDVSIVRCRFANNDAVTGAGIGQSWSAPGSLLVEDCTFEDCSSFAGACVAIHRGVIRRSVFRRNSCEYGAADLDCVGGIDVEGCLFDGSPGPFQPGKSSVALLFGETHVSCTTFVRTEGRSAIKVAAGARLALARSIVAFGLGGNPPIRCEGSPEDIAVVCTDVFGNEAGDWVGCLAGRDASDGNLAADPLFCDLATGDFGIRSTSPCAPAHSGECGLIGALPVGCGTTALSPVTWGRIKGQYR